MNKLKVYITKSMLSLELIKLQLEEARVNEFIIAFRLILWYVDCKHIIFIIIIIFPIYLELFSYISSIGSESVLQF